jgi:hypothetical protein
MENRPSHSPSSGAPLAEGVAAKLVARRRRVRAIRTRVAGLSVATLMATSGVVVVQMVTGNDPALAKTHPNSDATTAAETTAAASAGAGATTSDARTTTSRTAEHRTRRRSSGASRRAAATPTTVTTSAS